MKLCKDFLIANRDNIPLKTEMGSFRKGNVFFSNIPEYFNGPLLRSHIASKECKGFAKMLQCNSISEIGPIIWKLLISPQKTLKICMMMKLYTATLSYSISWIWGEYLPN